mmetsp:Transcript_22306/g.53512  ORF Transcript_22306/g.53512 Transcript_22306/m.53512 type:complete len:283 (+) Transcript_22306:600-1448(+)
MHMPVNVDLALCDVPGEVGDGVRDVVVRHRQHRHLGDGATTALDAPSALVDGGKIRVHVPGVPAATGHLLARGRHLAEGVGVGRHVREDDEDVLVALVREVLRDGQRETRGDDPLDRGIVGKVKEEAHVLHRAVLLEILLEKARRLHVDTHGREHDGEVGLARRLHVLLLLLHETGLPADLGGDFVVGKTGGREKGDLLPARDRVHRVDRGNTGLDHLLGVDTRRRVDGHAHDVKVVLREHRGALVDGLPGAVEDAAKHVLRHRHAQHLARELHLGVLRVDA